MSVIYSYLLILSNNIYDSYHLHPSKHLDRVFLIFLFLYTYMESLWIRLERVVGRSVGNKPNNKIMTRKFSDDMCDFKSGGKDNNVNN